MYQLEDFTLRQYSDFDISSPEVMPSQSDCDPNNDYPVPEVTFTSSRTDADSQEYSNCPTSRNHVSSWKSDSQSQLHCKYSESFSWTPGTQPQLNTMRCSTPDWKSDDLSPLCNTYSVPGCHVTPQAYDTNSQIGSNYLARPQHTSPYYNYDQHLHGNCCCSFRQVAGSFKPYTFPRSLGLKPVCMQTVDSFYQHPRIKAIGQQDHIRKRKASLSERKRLESVNCALELLRLRIPFEKQRHHKMSKVKILRFATEYIKELSSLLENIDK